MEWNDHYDKETLTLRIPWNFNSELINLPPDVKIIVFAEGSKSGLSSFFDKKVGCQDCMNSYCAKNLPNNLKYLTFGVNFNQSLDNLPSKLTHLTIGYSFNQNIDKLPSSLTHLTFVIESKFNQIVDKLPSCLTHLTFGYDFNQNIDKLPNKITHLTFGSCFNKSIDKLPTNLIYIEFTSSFIFANEVFEKVDNIGLKFYSNDYFNKIIDNLPSNIKQIKINKRDKLHFIKKIPFGCKIIDADDNEIFL